MIFVKLFSLERSESSKSSTISELNRIASLTKIILRVYDLLERAQRAKNIIIPEMPERIQQEVAEILNNIYVSAMEWNLKRFDGDVLVIE